MTRNLSIRSEKRQCGRLNIKGERMRANLHSILGSSPPRLIHSAVWEHLVYYRPSGRSTQLIKLTKNKLIENTFENTATRSGYSVTGVSPSNKAISSCGFSTSASSKPTPVGLFA